MTSTRRLWLIVLGVLFAVGCGGAALLATHLFQGRRAALDAVMDDLRARGEPVTCADLAVDAPADADVAAARLRAAWDEILAQPPPIDSWPRDVLGSQAGFEACDAEVRDAVHEWVLGAEPAIERMLSATTEYSAWRFEAEPELFSDKSHIPGLHISRHALLLALRCSPSRAGAPAGDAGSNERIALLRGSGVLAAHWLEPPSLIERMVQVILVQGAVRELRSQLELGRVDATAARRALEPVLEFDARAALRGSLRAERVSLVTLGRRFAGDDPGPLPMGDVAPAWTRPHGRRALARFALDVQVVLDLDRPTWRELSVRLPPWTSPGLLPALAEGLGGRLVATARILFPRVVLAAARLSATQSLARLSLAAVEHFDATGLWPESLDGIDVAAEHRIDPFSDEPFVFERLPDGIRLSSPGPVDRAIWGDKPVNVNDPQAGGLVWTLRR